MIFFFVKFNIKFNKFIIKQKIEKNFNFIKQFK